MSNNNKSISYKSMLLTVSNLASRIVTLIAAMVVARMLDTVAYATYKQTFLAFNFALPFLSFGLTQGLYYFIPMEKKRVRGRINDCYTVYAAAGIAFSLFILLGVLFFATHSVCSRMDRVSCENSNIILRRN